MSSLKRLKLVPQVGRSSASESHTAPAVSPTDSGEGENSTATLSQEKSVNVDSQEARQVIQLENDASLGTPIGNPANTNQKKRMRWTKELNLSLMSAYLRATDEDSDLTGYRDRLQEIWQEEHPNIPMTAQRLTDQVRSIKRRGAISQAEIENLKSSLKNRQVVRNYEAESKDQQGDNLQTPPENDDKSDSQPSVEMIKTTFEILYAEMRDTPHHLRPKLSKIVNSYGARKVMRQVDNIIREHLAKANNIEETTDIIYSAALTVLKELKIEVIGQKRNKQTKKNAFH